MAEENTPAVAMNTTGAPADAPVVGNVVPFARDLLLDNAKAVLIILVVMGHMFGMGIYRTEPYDSFHALILLFHMPAFVWVTGRLSKPDVFTPKGLRSLFFLTWGYVVFRALNLLWNNYLDGGRFTIFKSLLHPEWATWFFVSLICWRLMLPLFAVGESRRAAVISVIAAVGISVASAYLLVNGRVLSIARTLAFLPYFVAGYRARQQAWRMPRTWWTRVLAVAIFTIAFVALYQTDMMRSREVLYMRNSFVETNDATLEAGLKRIGLTTISGLLIFSFLQLMPKEKTPITRFGTTTLAIYGWHVLVLRVAVEFGFRDIISADFTRVAVSTALMVVVLGMGPIATWTVALFSGRRV